MRLRFDQLGKQIGQQALGPCGPTVAHDEISADAQYADLRHDPDPRREAERARLGLLGRLASRPCIIEIFSHAPDEDEVLGCAGKLIAYRRKRARALRRRRTGEIEHPFLWIIAAGDPAIVLAALGSSPARGWPAGVYFGPELFRVGIVVASELPRDRETLLVRLMAAGPVLARAIQDLGELPPEAHERAVAEPILLNLRHVLVKKPSRTHEEQEFIMTMHKTWADARNEGRREGRVEEAAHAVLTVLRARGIAVSDAARERILAQRDRDRLERWLERAAVVASVAEVMGEPS